ncbi:MAG: hypothetical protein M1339_07025 [Bacteroidetes bacterium]|nr:hypothetical protein [Bacteroidota bacterium]
MIRTADNAKRIFKPIIGQPVSDMTLPLTGCPIELFGRKPNWMTQFRSVTVTLLGVTVT